MFEHLRDLFASLNSHGVKYVVIGGVAAISHGVARATIDVDLLVEATVENMRRLLAAMMDAADAQVLEQLGDEEPTD